jgi:glycosyltransferase involved in cell wall biosynthesis
MCAVAPGPRLVSVVMPVLDGEEHIADQLSALAAQTYAGPWELVVVDNGCTDRTVEIVRAFSSQLPMVTVADATDRIGLNHARNVGAFSARGDLLAFCDADDVACTEWLAAMAEAAREADIIGGRLESETLNDPVIRAWHSRTPMCDLPREHGFLPYAPGGNLGVWTPIAREIGWDERFTFGSSDFAFAWRAQLAGYRLAFAPRALMRRRLRSSMRAMARQHFRYGQSDPKVFRAYRHLGLPNPDNRRALRIWRRLLTTLPDLWHSRERRGSWVRLASFRTGRLVGSVQARVVCL